MKQLHCDKLNGTIQPHSDIVFFFYLKALKKLHASKVSHLQKLEQKLDRLLGKEKIKK